LGNRLAATDEVVIETTGDSMAVSRVLSRLVARVIIANPLQVKAIVHAHVKTDKVDAGTLASLRAAGYLPEIWTPDVATERNVGWWPGATKSFVIAHDSRTRSMRSCTRT
jgi:transposase